MIAPTIIKHEKTAVGFTVMVSYTDVMGFNVAVQEYRIWNNGEISLMKESIWSSEQSALIAFKKAAQGELATDSLSF